jgi:hypothetical protein
MKRKFNALLNNAKKAIMKLKSKEDDLLMFLQPYFNEEIAVLYQESDGFVVLFNMDNEDRNHSNLNSGVEEVFENIQKDKNFYKKQKT